MSAIVNGDTPLFVRERKRMFVLGLSKSGLITAIDLLEIKQCLIVDVMGVALAHPAASLGNGGPCVAENIAPAQNGAADGIGKPVDELRRGHFLRIHGYDEGTQLLGAFAYLFRKRGITFAELGLPVPIVQLVVFLIDLELDLHEML